MRAKRDERQSALWGSGRDSRGRAALTLALFALSLVFTCSALAGAADKSKNAFVPSALLSRAQQSPDQMFNVIVRGNPDDSSASIATYFTNGHTARLKDQFDSISGVAGSLSGTHTVQASTGA